MPIGTRRVSNSSTRQATATPAPISFTVKANDGALDSNIRTININVTDQAPVIAPIPTTPVLHGQTVSIDVPAVATDDDLDPLTYSVVAGATNGYAYWDPSSQQFIYEASNSYTGPESFTVTAHDGAQH